MVVLLLVFVVIVYVYTIVKLKKSREKTKNINSVQDFHNSYQHLINRRELPDRESIRKEKTDSYRKYVTKYNSTEDYREK
ncbi:MAG: hypothetical protein HFI51_06485 [Lachnospiraceae bacterium]|nr:hypothetical protein [Lachnospiraceae bacterium]